jgi:hypothetical protein
MTEKTLALTPAERQKAYRQRATEALRNAKAAESPPAPLLDEIATSQATEIAGLRDELDAARATIRRLKARHLLSLRRALRHVTHLRRIGGRSHEQP